ncbi:MAG: hypothetical protein Q4E47_01830 [Candidatus Saccharibacteria bacterium]|nr:hypothetical protein [Candidatus Saccharibacteria bacterium]
MVKISSFAIQFNWWFLFAASFILQAFIVCAVSVLKIRPRNVGWNRSVLDNQNKMQNPFVIYHRIGATAKSIIVTQIATISVMAFIESKHGFMQLVYNTAIDMDWRVRILIVALSIASIYITLWKEFKLGKASQSDEDNEIDLDEVSMTKLFTFVIIPIMIFMAVIQPDETTTCSLLIALLLAGIIFSNHVFALMAFLFQPIWYVFMFMIDVPILIETCIHRKIVKARQQAAKRKARREEFARRKAERELAAQLEQEAEDQRALEIVRIASEEAMDEEELGCEVIPFDADAIEKRRKLIQDFKDSHARDDSAYFRQDDTDYTAKRIDLIDEDGNPKGTASTGTDQN